MIHTPDFTAEVLPLRPDLFATALRYTRNASDAEDLVQDTLIRAFKAWDKYESREGSNCKAWLVTILTNCFINTYRRGQKHHKFTHESGDEGREALYGPIGQRTTGPDANVMADLGDEVRAALKTLGAEYRQVAELAWLDGQMYREIAYGLGIPMGTVMSRLHRARVKLQGVLADYAGECGIVSPC